MLSLIEVMVKNLQLFYFDKLSREIQAFCRAHCKVCMLVEVMATASSIFFVRCSWEIKSTNTNTINCFKNMKVMRRQVSLHKTRRHKTRRDKSTQHNSYSITHSYSITSRSYAFFCFLGGAPPIDMIEIALKQFCEDENVWSLLFAHHVLLWHCLPRTPRDSSARHFSRHARHGGRTR